MTLRKARLDTEIFLTCSRTTVSCTRTYINLNLQEDLTSLGQWETDWQMTFSVAKQLHSMRVIRHQHHIDYSLHNQTSGNVLSAKYIGITISDNTDWVNIFQKFLPKHLRHSVSFAGTLDPVYTDWSLMYVMEIRCRG